MSECWLRLLFSVSVITLSTNTNGKPNYLTFLRLESAIPLLHRVMASQAELKNVVIAFPDDGAYKRFNSHFPDAQTVICTKVRDGKKRIVRVKDGRWRFSTF